jgi:hypothetical protein
VKAARMLTLHRVGAPLTQEQKGALRDAAEIALAVFSGKVSKRWVFANVPPYYRHKVGRLVLYYEGEVRQWADTLREQAA